MEWLHAGLMWAADWATLFFEWMGVLIILATGVKGAVEYFSRNPVVRLDLAKGLAMGLEFKLGSEILRTVVVRELSEILTVAGIIALRAALTLLIHWEIRNAVPGEAETEESKKTASDGK